MSDAGDVAMEDAPPRPAPVATARPDEPEAEAHKPETPRYPGAAPGLTSVNFPAETLGLSIEADPTGSVYVAHVADDCPAYGVVSPGDVLARVADVDCPGARDAAAWETFVAGVRAAARPLTLHFAAAPSRKRARTPKRSRDAEAASRAADDEEADEEDERDAAALRAALAASMGPAPAGSLAAPVQAESTRKKYWRARVSSDLAPRNAPLRFVWPNPKAHLTSKSGRRTAVAYEQYCTARTVAEFFGRGGRADDLAYDLARGFAVVADAPDAPKDKKPRGEAARKIAADRAAVRAAAEERAAQIAAERAAAALAASAPPAAPSFNPPVSINESQPEPAPPRVVASEPARKKARSLSTDGAPRPTVAVRPAVPPPAPKAATVADLAAYLAARGAPREHVEGWTVSRNQRGDTIFLDPDSGRTFRSKPEVARYLGYGPKKEKARPPAPPPALPEPVPEPAPEPAPAPPAVPPLGPAV